MADTLTNVFVYNCTEGHHMESSQAQTKCKVIVRGSPCRGALVRTGPGSRGAALDGEGTDG